ncbi:uncharacterized protein PV09_04939 [Verruconis gallopava]|uniref:Uncharacterized protein n=1 Tax=Verruconis gallopava TaxID=253628 RepID=A0A0D1XNI0_9PEZI|nr:uncharacterized protein PV09_04939 [Verruconis gallopava]KIW04131.1 hypothetical protein PV09_04939 [Verruconis gallopava]
MQVASVLSDLTSLRVCDGAAAQKLVMAYRGAGAREGAESGAEEADPDLQRAKDLVDLHNNVKVKLEEQGLDPELEELRRKVERLVEGLSG